MRAFILHRPKWMLDGFPTLVHGLWVLVNGAHAPGRTDAHIPARWCIGI
jgi:hypothetical protein